MNAAPVAVAEQKPIGYARITIHGDMVAADKDDDKAFAVYAAPLPAIDVDEAIQSWCMAREWIEPTEDGDVCVIPVSQLAALAAYLKGQR